MKLLDMEPMEGVSTVSRPWLCTYLCDQLLHFGYGLECDSLSMFVYVFTFMDESQVVDPVYKFYDGSHGRVDLFIPFMNEFCSFWDS